MPLDKIIETYTKETGGVKIMDVWKVDRENEVIYKIKKSSTKTWPQFLIPTGSTI